jgi:hypothetical protein
MNEVGWRSLGDRVTPTLIVGALLAISGVAITQMKPALGQIEPKSHIAATSAYGP